MRDLRPPALPAERGEFIVQAEYSRDFRERDAPLANVHSWKLERRQHFEEQGAPSRDALRRGEWTEALRLLDERSVSLAGLAEEDKRRGYVFHRVRVVEEPLTPYIQWELHSLRQRVRYGEEVRVVHPGAFSEDTGPLPEIVVLGGRVLYDVRYTPEGVPDGAVRFTDPETVGAWETYLKCLYASGEDLVSYFDRVVSHLPPPQPATE